MKNKAAKRQVLEWHIATSNRDLADIDIEIESMQKRQELLNQYADTPGATEIIEAIENRWDELSHISNACAEDIRMSGIEIRMIDGTATARDREIYAAFCGCRVWAY
ncbi:MAG: hypothetical protein V4438_02355 [Patescibacteria group bacterium]